MLTPSTLTSFPVASLPKHLPRCVPVSRHRVTTVSPSATISSTTKLISGNAAHHFSYCNLNDSLPTPNLGSLPATPLAINRSIALLSP
jgi:hypothetical protein